MTKTALIISFVIFGLKANAQYDPYAFGKFPFNFEDFEITAKISVWGDTIKPLFINGKFYYKNILSNKLIANKGFDEAYPFCKEYSAVKINGRYGIINRVGEIVVEPNSTDFAIDDSFPYIYLGDKQFDYNTGKLTPRTYNENYPNFPEDTIYRSNDKYGVKFKHGHKIEAIYDSILSVGYSSIIVVKISSKIGAIDKNGRVVIPLAYDKFTAGYPDQFALRSRKTWKYFRRNRLLFSSKNEPVYWRYDNIIYKSNGYYGCMDAKGNSVLTAKYKWISLISPIAINKNNQVVFYSKDGREFVYYAIQNVGSQK